MTPNRAGCDATAAPGAKKPAGEIPAGEDGKDWGDSDHRFRQRRRELDGMRMVSLYAVELMASLQHAVEFVHQHGDGFVAVISLNDGVQIGPMNLDVALSLELHADRSAAITFQFHADTHDAFLMAEETFGLLANEGLERRSQLKMNARNDHFVVVLAVHVSAFGLG